MIYMTGFFSGQVILGFPIKTFLLPFQDLYMLVVFDRNMVGNHSYLIVYSIDTKGKEEIMFK